MKTVRCFLTLALGLALVLSCDNKTVAPEGGDPQPPVNTENDVKAAYSDFLGNWKVTGTEHAYFGEWHERDVRTFSYSIQIIENEDGKSYLIENWETGATDTDKQCLYYGSTENLSIYDYYQSVVKKYIGIVARYDAATGTLQIDRQTFATDYSSWTVEFLGSTRTGNDTPTPRGSFASNISETPIEYTICDFVLQKDGSVSIRAHKSKGYEDLAFMGYAQYYGWYPTPKYYNTQFAFPFSMTKLP